MLVFLINTITDWALFSWGVKKEFFLTNLRPCQRSSHGFEDQDTIKTVICIKLFYFFYQNLSLELYFCGGKEKEIRSSYFLKTSIE